VTPDPHNDIATDWFLRLRQPGADGPLRAAFAAWRDADPAHAAAYARVEQVWAAPALTAALRDQPGRRHGLPLMRLAASIAVVMLVGSGALRLAGIPAIWPADYATRVGQQQTVRLADGSRLVLDSGAAVDVTFSGEARTVTLRAGRAFVDVGKDPRPFRVLAGDVALRDIGTRFSIDRRGSGAQVAVDSGEVALRPSDTTTSEQHLRGGEVGCYDAGFLPVHTEPRDMTFAWLDHRLFFAQAPLGQVVEALRRYHRGWIVIANPRLAAIRVSGGYDTRDTPAAMADLARLSRASLIRVSDHLLILR
jgi:transmembrane sensor